MTLKHQVRQLVRRLGLDIIRYPLHDPLARTVKLLDQYQVDCVIDVGANNGGFASAIRSLGYSGRIVSFEPLRTPYETLRQKASADNNWEAVNCAIGDSGGEVTINISGNSGLSSSILPMLDIHVNAAPSSRYVATETVRKEQLDEILPQLGVGPANRTFLKVDVQGYESAVLDGASGLLADSSVVGLQLELSLVPLYGGAMTYREGFDRADALGMTLMGLDPVLADPNTGQLLQVDAVFFRT